MIPPHPRRTIFTMLFGVLGIVAGGLGSLFSAFALLLAIGKPYANGSPADPLGIFLIFILPPVTLLAGIGLLLRHRWARWWMVLLMLGLAGLGVKGLVAPDIANPAYAPLPGPAADAAKRIVLIQSLACVAVGGCMLLGLFAGSVRREFGSRKNEVPPPLPRAGAAAPSAEDARTGWRVGHRGRDMMFYEEYHDGEWRRIEISGEMLMGAAHHVIYFAGADGWKNYPEWARHRRDEIIARVKSRFTPPDYEYLERGTVPAASVQVVAVSPARQRQDGSIAPALLFLAFIAVVCFWFCARGIEAGEVRVSSKFSSGNSMVTKMEKPALYWTSIGVLAAFGTGSAACGAWLVFHRLRR